MVGSPWGLGTGAKGTGQKGHSSFTESQTILSHSIEAGYGISG